MIRFLNLLAVAGLLGSALWAYQIKYDTLLHVERTAKLVRQLAKERIAVATLRAEWAKLERPDRLQGLADANLDLVPLAAGAIIASAADLPRRGPAVDSIGRKLDDLGLALPTATPTAAAPAPATPKTAAATPRQATDRTGSIKPKLPAVVRAPAKPAGIADLLRSNPAPGR